MSTRVRHTNRPLPRARASMWSARARRDPTCRPPAARSAPGASRRPSRTTCAGSATDGRRCRATGARWCCTPPSTTPRSPRSVSHGARKVIDLWAQRTAELGAARRRRLRARASRTAAPRWAPPSPTRTVRSTPTTTSPNGRCACWRRSGHPTSNPASDWSSRPTAGSPPSRTPAPTPSRCPSLRVCRCPTW